MSYILDALRKAETERRSVSLGDQVTPRSRVPFKTLVTILVVLNATLVAWLLMDPTTIPSRAQESVEKSTYPIAAGEEVLQKKSAEGLTSAITTPRPSPPDVSTTKENDASDIRPQLVYYSDFEAVVGSAFPPLSITIHTYTADPLERAIHIDGNMWREGDEIGDGMILKSITESGVEVTYQGYLVLIDVFEMWNTAS